MLIDRYIVMEMIPPFVINLGFFTFIFIMTRMLEITNLIINFRIDLSAVIWLLIFSMPYFLTFVIPMSVMMAVLLTFLRMSGDNEITALRSAGISLYRLLPPVFFFCLLGTLLTGFFSMAGMPWGKRSFHRLAIELAEKNINAGLKERTFNDSFDGIMLYVNKIDSGSKELIDVFVEQNQAGNIKTTIVAPRGVIFSEPDKHLFHLRLYNGSINQVNIKSRTANTVAFDLYEINLDLKETMRSAISSRKELEEMTPAELKRFVDTVPETDDRYYTALLRYHEKHSIPVACFALGLLAVPLGLQSRSDRRSLGVVTGLVLFLGYYILLSVGWSFGESGGYPPLVGMWIPNAVTGGIGAYLLWRAATDNPLRFDAAYTIKQWFRRFK
ncbi:MAG: LPS export ABC transporter permease LptF [Thermodesulfobacteriota bacterium]